MTNVPLFVVLYDLPNLPSFLIIFSIFSFIKMSPAVSNVYDFSIFFKYPLHKQVFLAVDTAWNEPLTLFMSNYTFQEDAGNWEAVETVLVIPACFDQSFSGSGFGLCIKNFIPLLQAAVLRGTFLTVKHLTQIARVMRLKIPEKGEGSGKKRQFGQDRLCKKSY